MKISLINPPDKNINEVQRRCYPPMGLLYLATCLTLQNHKVEIIEANALKLSYGQILNKLISFSPDLIGIPMYMDIYHQTFKLTKTIRQSFPKPKILLGGPVATAVPEKVMEEFPGADFLLKGDSEKSIVELCNVLENKSNYKIIKGLSYRENRTIIHNPAAAEVKNLDDIPHPDRSHLADIYKNGKYFALLSRHRPVDAIITSRGCPYHCKFCYNSSNNYRCRSPQDVVKEILKIHSLGIKTIEICDDNFTLDRERAIAIFKTVIKEKLKIALRIKSKVSSVDEELIKMAKKAGVYQISYGMESAVQKILDSMQKETTVRQNEDAIRITKNAGIKCHTSWLFGWPGETPEDIQQNIKFIIATKPTTVFIGPIVPYPKTPLYEESKTQGTLIGDWKADSEHIPWIKLPWAETKNEILRWINYAYRKIYYRPFYALNFGKEILKNANTNLAKYALQEIRKSLKNLH